MPLAPVHLTDAAARTERGLSLQVMASSIQPMSVREIRPAKWCLYEYKACPLGCPLDAAEARLREAHRRWHEAADAYQAPDDFRDAVNSCVQALRNVTFMLQAAKAAVPGFNDWYPREQVIMAADRILKWVVKPCASGSGETGR